MKKLKLNKLTAMKEIKKNILQKNKHKKLFFIKLYIYKYKVMFSYLRKSRFSWRYEGAKIPYQVQIRTDTFEIV